MGKNNVNNQNNTRIMIKENSYVQGKDVGAWMSWKINS